VVDHGVAREEGQRAGEEAESDSPGAGRCRVALEDELVRNGADEHAGAEGHDEAENAPRDRVEQGEEPADEQRRRSEKPPAERSAHEAAF
jgi:hypothetical protein